MTITLILVGVAFYVGYKRGKKQATSNKPGCLEKVKRVFSGLVDVIKQEFGNNQQPAQPQVQPNVPQPTPAPQPTPPAPTP